MQESAGSYEFGAIADPARELERLRTQAVQGAPIEVRVWEWAGLRPGMKVLDLACGPGFMTRELARMVPEGEVTGLDLSEELLALGRAELVENPLSNVEFRQGNVYELDLPPDTYDFVYARLLFQHLVEPDKALAQIKRVLKPSGVLCILDVDESFLAIDPEPASFAAFNKASIEAQRASGGDRFVGRKLGRYLSEAGFADVKTRIETATSDQVDMRSLIDITFGARYRLFMSPELQERNRGAMQEIYGLLELPYAWLGVGVFAAAGIIP